MGTQTSMTGEIEELRSRLKEAEETLNAIRNGEVDAIIVSGADDEKIFSLTSAETPYRIFLEEMEEGAVTLNSNGIILYCNQRFSTLLSKPIGQIVGSDFVRFISPNDKRKFSSVFKKGSSGRASEVISFISDGNILPLHLKLSFRALFPDTGSEVYIIASDVTGLKESQQKLKALVKKRTSDLANANDALQLDLLEIKNAKKILQESEKTKSDLLKKLNQAQQLAMIGSWDWNLQTNQVWWSDETYRIFGESPEDYVPGFESSDEFIHPDDLSVYNKAFEHSLKTGEPLDIDGRLITREGLLKYCNAKGNVIFNNVRKPIHFVGTIMDITERTKAQNAVRDAQSKLNIALENGNIGVWEWYLTTDEMIWDERLEKMFDLKPGEFGKTYQAFENLVNEEDISHIQKSVKEALEKDLPFETIYRVCTKNGKIKYISSKGLVSKDKDGKPISMSGVCFDVTGLKEGTEVLISKLNEELLRSNKELQSFAYVASHDLQEPLRMVTSFTQLLFKQYEDKLDETAKEYINFAVDGATRMYDLLNGLLAYSRIHTKGQEFKKVNINNVFRIVTKNLSLLIKERGTEITYVKLPVVIADESQMILLFQNLISNSIKFSPESSKIIVSVKNKKDYFVFSVKDEGMGIEPQYFERIFLIFQRLVPREKYEGTGIGLAICKRIVERHGGSIWLESEIGKGSTFYFTIPNKT